MPLLPADPAPQIHLAAEIEEGLPARTVPKPPAPQPPTPASKSRSLLRANLPLAGVWAGVMLLCLGGTAVAQGDVGMPPLLEPPQTQVLACYTPAPRPYGDPTAPPVAPGIDPIYLVIVGIGQAVGAGFALLTAAVQSNAKAREAQIKELKEGLAKSEVRRDELSLQLANERDARLRAEIRLEALDRPPAARSWPGDLPTG